MIILASQSARRKEILAKCGYDFTCMPSDIDETIDPANPLFEEIQTLSYRKAMHIFKDHQEDIVIGADTVVTLGGKVFGKPKDANEAKEMLQALQGRSHEVVTGYTVIDKNRCFGGYEVVKVTFCKMDEKEIEAYIQTGEGYDKAGSYGIQGFGGRYVEKIEGDYYSVMGLPLAHVYRILQKMLADEKK